MQIGAVLLFAALIIAFSSYQAFVVPNQNKEVEFNHNQRVQGQLQEMRNAVVSVPGGNTGRSVGIDLGVRYPSRLVAMNPGPTTGTLRTVGTTDQRYNLTIKNATALDDEVDDFWTGTNHTFSTGSFVYTPGYNRYEAPRTTYENSVLYNERGETTVPLTGQRLIEGDRLTLVTLNGSLGTTRTGTTTVDLRALSSSTRAVSVRNQSHNVTIELPTRLSAPQWRNLTSDEKHVEGLTVDEGALDGEWGLLRLDLAPGPTYDLRMAKVGLGTGTDGTNGTYLVDVRGDGETLTAGESTTLVVEARDAFNNPVSGVTVYGEASGGSLTHPANATAEDGQVQFEYTAPESGTSDTVSFSTAYDLSASGVNPTDDAENVTMTLSIGSGTTTDGSAFTAFWEGTSSTGVTCDAAVRPERCTLDGAQSSQMSVTLGTSPAVENAAVDYAINDSTVGVLDAYNGTTDGAGQNGRTFTASANGTTALFAESGGSSDRLVVEVINVGIGENSPVVDSLTVTDRSNFGRGARFDADWTVSDPDGDLSQVTVRLVGAITGTTYDTVTTGVSGGTASDTTTLNSGGAPCGFNYDIVVEVTDNGGRTTTATQTETATC